MNKVEEQNKNPDPYMSVWRTPKKRNYQPTCYNCQPEKCDYIECDKRQKFQDEESAKLRTELKSFMDVKT